jgi:hypothetical protein
VLEESYDGDVVLVLHMRVDCGSGLGRLVVSIACLGMGKGICVVRLYIIGLIYAIR